MTTTETQTQPARKVFRIEFLGNPVPKGRPRFAGSNRFGGLNTYTPEKTATAECELAVKAQAVFKQPLTAPVSVHARYYCPIPKSASKADAALMRLKVIRPITTPDSDNLIKLTLDALNGIAWVDDGQVVSLSARKFYADVPMTKITIFTLKARGWKAITAEAIKKSVEKVIHKLLTTTNRKTRYKTRRFR